MSGDRPLRGSFAYPWDSLTDRQRAARTDQVLDWAGDFVYVPKRDAYRSADAEPDSPDFAPADAVEERVRCTASSGMSATTRIYRPQNPFGQLRLRSRMVGGAA